MTEPRHPFRPLPPDFLSELFHDPLDPGYTDAAARRAAGARTGWQPGARAVTLAALVVVGLLFAIAYRQVVAEEPERAQVRADLERQIDERQAGIEQLRDRAEELRAEVGDLRDRALDDPTAVRELRELEAATGLSAVRGDGLVVRLADGEASVDPVTGEPAVDPEARILYRDLQEVTNALWAAGAEAVAINGQRLTTTASIRAASGAILVDHRPVAGPYEVAAVGPPQLRERFAASPAARLMGALVDEYGIGYEVRSAADLELPAASAPRLFHATPAGGDR